MPKETQACESSSTSLQVGRLVMPAYHESQKHWSELHSYEDMWVSTDNQKIPIIKECWQEKVYQGIKAADAC